MKYRSFAAFVIIVTVLFNAVVSVGASDWGAPALPEVTLEQIREEMTTVIERGHPYMIATDENVNKLKEYAFGRDEFLTKQYAIVKAEADELLTKGIFTIDSEVASNSMNNTKAMWSYTHIMTLGIVYLVEGDTRYAERAWRQVEYLCSLDSWGKLQLIDNVQFAWAVGFCYDWLYDWLSDEQKATLITGLRRLHLDMASDVYKNPDDPKYKYSFHQAFFSKENHGIMDNSCTFLASMAIAETDFDFMTELMWYSHNQFNVPLVTFYPDGAWIEGYSYWSYAGPYVARHLQAMKSAFGHCFGYDELDFIGKLADFPIYITSDYAAITTDNSHFQTKPAANPIYYTIGSLTDNIGLQKLSVRKVNELKNPDAVFLLMYDPALNYDGDIELSLDKHFRALDNVTMRSSYNGTQNTFAAMHVRADLGIEGMAHRGSIAFDALGERWISDMGRENYYTGYFDTDKHFNWYRTRTESGSCILINPSAAAGQEKIADVCVDTLQSSGGEAYAVSDLTAAYSTQVSSYTRGIQLTDNRRVLVVQDELVLKEASQVYSLFNIYKADVELVENGKCAILSKNGKKVYVTVDCTNDFTLGTMPAEPFETSPMPDSSTPNSPNPNFTKLFIRFDNAESVNVRVCFIPFICSEELDAVTCRGFEHVSGWSASSEMKDVPMLRDITIDGKSLDGFNSFNRCYDAQNILDLYSSEIVLDYDETKYTAMLIKDYAEEALQVLLVDNEDSANINSYMIRASVTALSAVKSTYTNSSYAGVMLGQEFYRLANNDELSVMYFRDTAPENCTKAELTIYASVVGDSVDTALRQCKLSSDTQLEYLSGKNAPISLSSNSVCIHGATNTDYLYSDNMQKLEYDITNVIPSDGGSFVFALLPDMVDDDYMVVASHRNSDYKLRPRIIYYYRTSQ